MTDLAIDTLAAGGQTGRVRRSRLGTGTGTGTGTTAGTGRARPLSGGHLQGPRRSIDAQDHLLAGVGAEPGADPVGDDQALGAVDVRLAALGWLAGPAGGAERGPVPRPAAGVERQAGPPAEAVGHGVPEDPAGAVDAADDRDPAVVAGLEAGHRPGGRAELGAFDLGGGDGIDGQRRPLVGPDRAQPRGPMGGAVVGCIAHRLYRPCGVGRCSRCAGTFRRAGGRARQARRQEGGGCDRTRLADRQGPAVGLRLGTLYAAGLPRLFMLPGFWGTLPLGGVGGGT